MRAFALAHGFAQRLCEGEIEHGREAIAPRILRDIPIVGCVTVDLAEDVEVGNSCFVGGFQHGRNEGLPEFRVHMPRGVDAKPVDPEITDPVRVDFDHSFDDAGVLGKQIVETCEIAEPAALSGEGRVAAVVVVDRIIQPGGNLTLRFIRRDHRRVGIGRVRQPGEIACATVFVAHETRIDRRAIHAAPPRIGKVALAAIDVIRRITLGVADHVGGVVGDDVHVDFHPARMRGVDEGLELGPRAEMAVGPCEIGYPIAVIPGTLAAFGALYRLVLEDRRKPDGGYAQPIEIIEPLRQAFQVTPMEEPLMLGVVTRLQTVPHEITPIVGGIAILEPVGKHEIDDLFGRRAIPKVRFAGAVLSLRRRDGRETERQQREDETDHAAVFLLAGRAINLPRVSAWCGIAAAACSSARSCDARKSRRSCSAMASASGL